MDFFTSDEWVEPEKGNLLISEPYLPDPNFERTVVLICEHDENGTIGFVLNRKAVVSVGDVMDDLAVTEADLYVGGPVEQDTLHFIHQNEALAEGGNEVIPGVYWGGSFEKMTSMANTRQLLNADIRFFVGYSGWSQGQLVSELKQKSWIVFKESNSSQIFDTSPEELWKRVLNDMGGKFKLISNYPTDPRLN